MACVCNSSGVWIRGAPLCTAAHYTVKLRLKNTSEMQPPLLAGYHCSVVLKFLPLTCVCAFKLPKIRTPPYGMHIRMYMYGSKCDCILRNIRSVCTYVQYIHMYISLYQCSTVGIVALLHTYVRMYIHTYIRMYVCIYIRTYVHLFCRKI